MNLHEAEYQIDDERVRQLLADQMPQWADLEISRLNTSGTVNIAYRLGDDMLIRLPRTADYGLGPEHEARWLPALAPMVPLTIPRHLALGTPSEAYPSHWSVLGWIEGTNASRETLDDLEAAASVLGDFVVALRQVPADPAPEDGNYRAGGLARVDNDLRRWVEQLPDDIDRGAVLGVWESCLSVGEWRGPPTWLHSDLRGDNLIADDSELVAVIDWEGCSVGDPSADYLAAWWLFEGDSREAFRKASQAQPSDWTRAKGWALHMAVAAIPYYAGTNSVFVDQARTALDQVLSEG